MIATTTLDAIWEHNPCEEGWDKLVEFLLKNEPAFSGKSDEIQLVTADREHPIPLSQVLLSNGLQDAIWCLRAADDVNQGADRFNTWCVQMMLSLAGPPECAELFYAVKRYTAGTATGAEFLELIRAAADAGLAAANAGNGGAGSKADRRAFQALAAMLSPNPTHTAESVAVHARVATIYRAVGRAGLEVTNGDAFSRSEFFENEDNKALLYQKNKFVELFCTETTETEDESK